MKKLFFLIASLAIMAACTQNENCVSETNGKNEEKVEKTSDVWLYEPNEINRTDYTVPTRPRIVGGNGDSSTTFNIPDLRGMFLRGVSDDSKTISSPNN